MFIVKTYFQLIVLSLSFSCCYADSNSIMSYLDNLFGKRLTSPPPTTIKAQGSITVAFSPNNGVTKTIVQKINQAQKLILISAYSFTSKEIVNALLDSQKRGVVIKLILDKDQYSHKYSNSKFLAEHNFAIRVDRSHAIFHDKIMIIDHNCVITGSFNFTRNAEQRNAENILILCDNPDLIKLYEQDWYFNWNMAVPYEEMRERR